MQPCPRQSESGMSIQQDHESHWRPDGTCSYCGSMSPEDLFAAIAEGYELGPTDKNYKVYVTRPDPNVGKPRISSAANFEQKGDGWTLVTPENIRELPRDSGFTDLIGRWVKVTPTSAMKTDKFYFQHLNEEERKRFVELLNKKKLNIGYPGRFYQLPFFAVRIN